MPLGLVELVPFVSQERHHFAWIVFALVGLFLEEFGLWEPRDSIQHMIFHWYVL